MVEDVVLDGFESEVALGDGGEAFDPVGDGELLDGELFWHGRKIITPKKKRINRERRNSPAKHDIL
jgi:hypothetical protein